MSEWLCGGTMAHAVMILATTAAVQFSICETCLGRRVFGILDKVLERTPLGRRFTSVISRAELARDAVRLGNTNADVILEYEYVDPETAQLLLRWKAGGEDHVVWRAYADIQNFPAWYEASWKDAPGIIAIWFCDWREDMVIYEVEVGRVLALLKAEQRAVQASPLWVTYWRGPDEDASSNCTVQVTERVFFHSSLVRGLGKDYDWTPASLDRLELMPHNGAWLLRVRGDDWDTLEPEARRYLHRVTLSIDFRKTAAEQVRVVSRGTWWDRPIVRWLLYRLTISHQRMDGAKRGYADLILPVLVFVAVAGLILRGDRGLTAGGFPALPRTRAGVVVLVVHALEMVAAGSVILVLSSRLGFVLGAAADPMVLLGVGAAGVLFIVSAACLRFSRRLAAKGLLFSLPLLVWAGWMILSL